MKCARWIPLLGVIVLFLGCERPPEAQYVPVDSSLIEAVRYDDATQTLTIRFINPPRTYEYEAVPPTVYAEFLVADSKGGFFNTYIRGEYDETLVSD